MCSVCIESDNMQLSSVYDNRYLWGMVYHIQPDSEVVEMISDRLFNTETEAWTWFHANHRIHHFIQPEAVKFHLGSMKLSRQE